MRLKVLCNSGSDQINSNVYTFECIDQRGRLLQTLNSLIIDYVNIHSVRRQHEPIFTILLLQKLAPATSSNTSSSNAVIVVIDVVMDWIANDTGVSTTQGGAWSLQDRWVVIICLEQHNAAPPGNALQLAPPHAPQDAGQQAPPSVLMSPFVQFGSDTTHGGG
jgi:hypothetical protein